MPKHALTVAAVLDRLEAVYGPQEPAFPTDPYLFLIWWHCGYPASDLRCRKGWESLRRAVGAGVAELLGAPMAKLTEALKPGGMVPELRAMRLKEIAARVKQEYGGDLRGGLKGPMTEIRRALKRFPNIADPGADRMILFAGIAPIAAIPSNCPHVLVRIQQGLERENYGVTYRAAQHAVETGVPETLDARWRAFLLLKRHGQEICKTRPLCEKCVVSGGCAYFAGKHRGRAAKS